MNGQEQPPLEKPYVLVDFAEGQKQGKPEGHDRLDSGKLSGQLELYLITRTPVQVASGSFDVRPTKQGEEVLALGASVRHYDAEGKPKPQPILPGSSLKGMMRSLVETISPSCIVAGSRDTRTALPENVARCTKAWHLCPACRLFGMSGAGRENYMGQVSVEDAVVMEGQGGTAIVRTPLLWSPARGQGDLPRRYMKGRHAAGRKVYYHSQPAQGPDARQAIKSRSVLRTLVHFENLTPAELGLLITALGLHPAHRFIPKIGGGKPVGLGSVETYIQTIELQGSIALSGRLGGETTVLRHQPAQLKIAECCKAAVDEQLVVERVLLDVAEVLKVEHLNRKPVEGMY